MLVICHARTRRAGFTLIEMIIVVSIIAILMATALVNASQSRDTASITMLQSEVVRLQQAMTDGYTETGQYPIGSSSWATTATGGLSYVPNTANVAYTVTVTSDGQGATIVTGTPTDAPVHTCSMSLGTLATTHGVICN